MSRADRPFFFSPQFWLRLAEHRARGQRHLREDTGSCVWVVACVCVSVCGCMGVCVCVHLSLSTGGNGRHKRDLSSHLLTPLSSVRPTRRLLPPPFFPMCVCVWVCVCFSRAGGAEIEAAPLYCVPLWARSARLLFLCSRFSRSIKTEGGGGQKNRIRGGTLPLCSQTQVKSLCSRCRFFLSFCFFYKIIISLHTEQENL